MLEMVTLEEALGAMADLGSIADTETVGLSKALGRVLSETLRADGPVPPFDKSPLDGYAVRAADTAGASLESPVTLTVVREVRAGAWCDIPLQPGQAVKILTGAPMPPGSDEVIRYEDVRYEAGVIRVNVPVKAYGNFCHQGEDIAAGEIALTAGTVLGPAEIGFLAGLGYGSLPVRRQLRVAVVSTGDELMEGPGPLAPGKIFNSNAHGLCALLEKGGFSPCYGGIAGDDASAIAQAAAAALKEADVLITTGGVSVGDYDLVEAALRSMGAEVVLRRIDMRPGTPVIGAVLDGKLIISLSGNPTAATVTYHLLAAPVLRKLAGQAQWQNQRTRGIFRGSFDKVRRQRRMLLSRLGYEDGSLTVSLHHKQSSGGVRALLGCDAFIDVPPHGGRLQDGDRVDVVLIGS